MDSAGHIKRNTKNKGFSLVEMLVAMAIIGIMIAIGMPALTSQISHLRLSRSTRDVATELNAARMKAIAKNLPHRVSFTLNASPVPDAYKMYYKEGGAWLSETTRAQFELLAGIDISSPGANFNVDFFPNGTGTSVDICLVNTSKPNDRMKINVEAANGKVVISTGC